MTDKELDFFNFNSLPNEMVVHILSFVCVDSLLNCRRVCKKWKKCIDSCVYQYKVARENEFINNGRGYFSFSQMSSNNVRKLDLPWFLFYIIFKYDPFNRNLVKNHCGQNQFNHWNIIYDSPINWIIEQPPQGASKMPNHPDFEGFTSCFASSYMRQFRSQRIWLKDYGLTKNVMKYVKPDIVVSEWHCGHNECGCQYWFKVTVYNNDHRLSTTCEYSALQSWNPRWIKVLKYSLKWLDDWEARIVVDMGVDITDNQFLIKSISERLHVTLNSCIEMIDYLIDKLDFKDVTSGKVNQDALEVYTFYKYKNMTEAVVSGKDMHCLFINNGDELLTLKKVVSKKSDKDDSDKQRSKETNGSELSGNHNKTDSIHFDVDNTSSLEPNLEMDSDIDRNITIDSICTQEDRESENIDVSNDNSNEADVKTDEKDNQAISINSSELSNTSKKLLDDNEYSNDLEDEDLESNVKSLGSYYSNVSSRAPMCSHEEFDSTLKDDIFSGVIIIDKKRKLEALPPEQEEQKSSKIRKLLSAITYPIKKKILGTASENESNCSNAELVIENDSIIPEATVSKDNIDYSDTKETRSNYPEIAIENTSKDTSNVRKFCSVM